MCVLHICLVVLVTAETSELLPVGRIRVTRGTPIPLPGMIPRVYWKMQIVVLGETGLGLLPAWVAGKTILRVVSKTDNAGMFGFHARLFVFVTSKAGDFREIVLIYVAIGTVLPHTLMCTRIDGEICRIVVTNLADLNCPVDVTLFVDDVVVGVYHGTVADGTLVDRGVVTTGGQTMATATHSLRTIDPGPHRNVALISKAKLTMAINILARLSVPLGIGILMYGHIGKHHLRMRSRIDMPGGR